MPTPASNQGDETPAAARIRELEELRAAIEADAWVAEQSYASLIEALAAAAGQLAEISRDQRAASARAASAD